MARQWEMRLTGLRNPWRIRFDRATGDLWIGDVGQGSRERCDVARAGIGGLDYGWNAMEGTTCFRSEGNGCAAARSHAACDRVRPRLRLLRDRHGLSRPRAPALRGWYVFADCCSGIFWAIDATQDGVGYPDDGGGVQPVGQRDAEDAAELYVTDLSGGGLYRVGIAGG